MRTHCMTHTATLYWIRRDLRLGDNPTLVEAINRGGPVIPVVINDDIQRGLGAASAYRLSLIHISEPTRPY